MNNQDLAQIADVNINTITSWKKEKPELIKLIKLGKKAEANLKTIIEFYDSQKDLLEINNLDLTLKTKKIKKIDLAKRINTTSHTLINWEKTKPELIRIVNLALLTEIHMKALENYLGEAKQFINHQ